MSRRHSHKLPKTRDRIVCPRATFFDWLKRIDNKQGRSIRDNKYGALSWNEDITLPAKRGQISLRLKKLLDLMGINGKQVYSFRHSEATQLEVMGLDETLLNTYPGHARNSKSTNNYYVFAERLKDNKIATKLSDTRGQVEQWDYWQLKNVQQYTATSPWSHPSTQFFVAFENQSLNLCMIYFRYYIIFINLLEMPSCNLDKEVDELLTMVSNKLAGMRRQQSFMGGYARAVR
ncbi:MAG: hypothetical protein EZS28_041418 [Streblomastix strix]|uniref:Tyr recombinase domain-containing protein n=1 Tax=Streblomastix strix TaxID=222440 RepID=A0A5J4TX44_9EUKA|nr:MAG: hypothetical protein EZS28_041418 [Streblomastix strix]